MERKFKLGEKVIVNGDESGLIVGIDLKADLEDLPYLVYTGLCTGKTIREHKGYYGPDLTITEDALKMADFMRAEWCYEDELQLNEKPKVKPPMLMDGYIVATRTRGNAIILGGRLKAVRHLCNKGGVNKVAFYDENLNSVGENPRDASPIDKEYDIMKVYEIEDMYSYTIEELINDLPEDGVNCIWTREEKLELTEEKREGDKRREKLEETMDKIIEILEDFLEEKN